MIKVKVKHKKDINRALKELKGKVFKTRMMLEIKDRRYFEKKSDKRRREIDRAAYREKKKRESEY
jgi:small subunit ribosomal protein S21